MLIHALQIVRQELAAALASEDVVLGNISVLDGRDAGENNLMKDKIVITLVNIREEKTLKNLPFSKRNDVTLKAEYFNPPVYFNLYLLVSCTHSLYHNALIYLSRVAAYLQAHHVFTHLNTQPITDATLVPTTERMEEFKLILDLYSPSFEEYNHIWGTLGGKQLPSIMYLLRVVEVERAVPPVVGGLVEEINLQFSDKK